MNNYKKIMKIIKIYTKFKNQLKLNKKIKIIIIIIN